VSEALAIEHAELGGLETKVSFRRRDRVDLDTNAGTVKEWMTSARGLKS